MNLGVKSTYAPWEIFLTRKLNYLTLVGFFNVSLGLGLFLLLGEYDLVAECAVVLAMASFVILLNIKKNYTWSAYLFYLIGVVLLFLLSLKMGYDSYVMLFYFPILISLVLLLGRREMLRHMFVLFAFFLVSIVAVVWLENYDFLSIGLTPRALSFIRPFNLVLSFLSAIALITIITIENARQEDLIHRMLREKEILMAEVFHRVKNNLNIVTSLLNLRKNASDSPEVQDALDDCRNRVFSMALVHQKIYSRPNIAELHFSGYIEDLVGELVNAFGGRELVDCRIDASDVRLRLSDAIPCGLIVNELVTNAFKYAQSGDRKLSLYICLGQTPAGAVSLAVSDNGPGFDTTLVQTGKSLGMELIRSLCDQLDARYAYTSENGCCFRMEFR